MSRIQEEKMADFELTPEAVENAAETQAAELEAEVAEVAAEAAAIEAAPAIDFAPEFAEPKKEEEKAEDRLARFTGTCSQQPTLTVQLSVQRLSRSTTRLLTP